MKVTAYYVIIIEGLQKNNELRLLEHQEQRKFLRRQDK